MQSKSDLDSSRPRIGFRDGWLYFHDVNGLHRFQARPRFMAEVRDTTEEWRGMSVGQRDAIGMYLHTKVDGFTSSRLWEPVGNVFMDPVTWQLCMPWVMDIETQRLTFACRHWQRFLAAVPTSLLLCIRRLGCDIFSALEMFAQVPRALDLVDHNPVLATALARHWDYPNVGRISWDDARTQVGNRRRDILGWLGFPATQYALNSLERIFWLHYSRPASLEIRHFMALLNDPDTGVFFRIGAVGYHELIKFFGHPLTRRWFDFKRFEELKSNARRADLCEHFREINQLLLLGVIDVDVARTIPWLKPKKQSLAWVRPYLNSKTFPPAAESASGAVVHLKSAADLIDEGNEMRHCIGSFPFIKAAMNGSIAVYRVSAPVRATLAISKKLADDKHYQLIDIKGRRNKEVSVEHIRKIAGAFHARIDFESWISRLDGSRYHQAYNPT